MASSLWDSRLSPCMYNMSKHKAVALLFLLYFLTSSAEGSTLNSRWPRAIATFPNVTKVAQGRRVLLATIFARGHTSPAMALAIELAKRGYHVTFAVQYRDGIADHFLDNDIFECPNVTFVPLPLPDLVVNYVRDDFRILADLPPHKLIPYSLQLLLDMSLEAASPLRYHIRTHQPDLFIADAAFFGAIMVAREFPELAFVRLSATMYSDPSSATFLPHFGLDFPVHMNIWQRYVSRAITAVFNSEVLFKLGIFSSFQKRAQELRLPPLHSLSDLRYGPVISQSMLGLEPPHAVEPGCTYCGLITMPKLLSDLPGDIREWLDERESVIYITMATTNAGTRDFWNAVVQGVGLLRNMSVLLAIRGVNKDRLPAPLPTNVLQVDWAPQTTVLMHPSVKAVVNGGGLNSINEAISASLPQIAIPFHADQFLNAASLARSGAGLRLDRRKLTPADVASALMRVTGDPPFRKQAERLQMIQQTAGGVRTAANIAELYLKLGARGMKLLEDATTHVPWHERTGADFLALQATLLLVIVWAKSRCFNYRTLMKV